MVKFICIENFSSFKNVNNALNTLVIKLGDMIAVVNELTSCTNVSLLGITNI
ncbi:MAG: hypothetical protein ACD_20C00337G0025 [uncultured bacterium]|nr:MAG: hypothetical protein ACD_20C00337G0025 [uncultured bacterium]